MQSERVDVMKRLQLSSHQQKVLLRKIFSLFERDPLLEFFKLRIETRHGETVLSVSGQRAGKDLAASAVGWNFVTVVQDVRDALLAQLPKRAEPRWVSEGPIVTV